MLIPLPICAQVSHELRELGRSMAYACDAATDDELSGSTTTRWDTSKLDDDADDHDAGTEEDGVPSSKFIAECKDEASTKKASDSIYRHHEALVGGLDVSSISFGHVIHAIDTYVAVYLREITHESRRSNDTAHDALVCDGAACQLSDFVEQIWLRTISKKQEVL